jgi:hypothetical protein
MGEYVRHSVNAEDSALELTNLYDAPLVAAAWRYKCETVRSEAFLDVSLSSAEPWGKGRTIPSTRLPESGCATTITAIIFADGKEVGDPKVLEQLHEHRALFWDEVHRLRQEDILSTKAPLFEWTPTKSVANLQARLAALPHGNDVYPDENDGYRGQALQLLIKELQAYQAQATADPSDPAFHKGKLLKFLQEWDEGLSSPTYSTERTYWRESWQPK